MLAASALAANMFMRSILAAAFPLFATYCEWWYPLGVLETDNVLVFHNLGMNWGMSLLGFIAVLMMPIPVL